MLGVRKLGDSDEFLYKKKFIFHLDLLLKVQCHDIFDLRFSPFQHYIPINSHFSSLPYLIGD